MKKLSTKIIAALVCACSLGFQAKATVYDISQVGSVQIDSIANDKAGSIIYNKGGTAVTTIAAGGGAAIFNFSGTINLSSIQPPLKAGDSIAIPITVTGSHFPNLTLSFTPNVSIGGQNMFTVTYNNHNYTNNVIYLVATSAITNGSGSVAFNLQGTATLSTASATTQQLANTYTTYTVDGQSYTINNAASPSLSAGNACGSYIVANAYASTSLLGVQYQIMCIYNQLLDSLNGTNTALNLSGNALLNTNLIQIATIPANSLISNVTIAYSANTLNNLAYVLSNNSQESTTNISQQTNTTVAFKPVNVTDTSMANLEATMKAGTYAIVKYPDNSYAIVVDWGTLLNNIYTQYAASYLGIIQGYDGNSATLLQQAMQDGLSAMLNKLVFTINYANTQIANSVPVTIKSNLASLLATNSGAPITTVPTTNNGNRGLVMVTYLNQYGAPIMSTYSTGYPPNTAGQTASQFSYTPPTDTLGLALLTPAQVQSLGIASKVGITSATVDTTIAYGDTSGVYYITPTNGSGASQAVQIYYVYGDLSTLPIIGLQLTAQPKGNTVQLSWGTLTEINSKNFTVQRSADGGNTWVTVNTQPTKAVNGNSSVPLSYTAQDIVLQSGSYEYRVVETDIDGSTTTSNVATVNISTNGSAVYPNPTKSVLNVVLPAGANSATYRMISSDGKIVLSGTMTNAGNHGTIRVAGIASGIYFLQVTVNNTMQTYEVQVQQ